MLQPLQRRKGASDMAEKDDLNLAEGTDAAQPKGGALKRVLMILVAVLLVAGAVGTVEGHGVVHGERTDQ